MRSEPKRGASQRHSRDNERKDRPRTRSMTKSKIEQERQVHTPVEHPALTRKVAKNGGVSESDMNNDGGSPLPNEGSPSVTRKKPRRGECEITVAETPPPKESPTTPVDSVEEEERVVNYFSQYLCLEMWRAVENCDVWDHRLVKAFLEGPRVFTNRIHSMVLHLRKTWKGGSVNEIQPENVARSYLESLRPKGLYNCFARIFKKRQIASVPSRPLKRKKLDSQPESQRFSMFVDGEGPAKKYKNRFLMSQPRLIVTLPFFPSSMFFRF